MLGMKKPILGGIFEKICEDIYTQQCGIRDSNRCRMYKEIKYHSRPHLTFNLTFINN